MDTRLPTPEWTLHIRSFEWTFASAVAAAALAAAFAGTNIAADHNIATNHLSRPRPTALAAARASRAAATAISAAGAALTGHRRRSPPAHAASPPPPYVPK